MYFIVLHSISQHHRYLQCLTAKAHKRDVQNSEHLQENSELKHKCENEEI